MNEYQPLFNALGGLATGLVILWVTSIQRKRETVERELNDFKLKVAETYMPKSDLKSAFDRIDKKFETTDAKLDEVLRLLNGKVDK